MSESDANEKSVPKGFDGALGGYYSEKGPDRTVIVWKVGPQHLQPFGIPHGGTYCTVHESAASVAGRIWLGTNGRNGRVVGTNNSTDFLRQAKIGETITTTATPIHRGRTQQIWRLESVGDAGRLIAQGQVRLANIDGEAPWAKLGEDSDKI